VEEGWDGMAWVCLYVGPCYLLEMVYKVGNYRLIGRDP